MGVRGPAEAGEPLLDRPACTAREAPLQRRPAVQCARACDACGTLWPETTRAQGCLNAAGPARKPSACGRACGAICRVLRHPAFCPLPTQMLDRLSSPSHEWHASVRFIWWLQYQLHRQLLQASRHAASRHVALKGDLPIGARMASLRAALFPASSAWPARPSPLDGSLDALLLRRCAACPPTNPPPPNPHPPPSAP